MNRLFLLAVAFIIVSCDSGIDYKKFKEAQDYGVPLWQSGEQNKSALFVFPHPDDEITSAGTADQLKKAGWTISLLTMTKGEPNEKALRTKEWENAGRILGWDYSEILDLPNNSWDNVQKNNIVFWYSNTDSIEAIIYQRILKYKPSIVFTYDTAIGGYGHPEHRMSAKVVNQIFQKHKGESTFSVRSVLQSTLPEKMEQLEIGNSEAVRNATLYTGNRTLPEPTLSFDIAKNWNVKRKASFAYESQRPILQKFFLLPDDADTIPHYSTFDREYFYEIK